MKGPRRKLFIDLADPEKRTKADILRALELVAAFQKHFDVVLGLNEKESMRDRQDPRVGHQQPFAGGTD